MNKLVKLSLALGVTVIFFTSSCTTSEATNTNEEIKISQTPKVKRFFSENSFWNQPIAADAKIDARSDKWIKMLESEPTKENFGVVWSQWTIPVYEVDSNTKMVDVKHHYLVEGEKRAWNTIHDRVRFEHGPNFNPVPIPLNAKPDPEGDAHFAIVDWNRMLAWDMWGLKQLKDGTWESKTGMCYRLDGDGTFDGAELGFEDNESVHFHGPSRAAGVPVFAGLIMYDEVMAGKIEHKLSCATRFGAYKEFVYPASWTDGYVNGGIPEGAVIRLDPKLDLTQFDLTKEETVIAVALQEYGMVIVDIAQGQPLYAEGLWDQPNKSWEGKLREWDGGINDIPYKHFQIMNVENAVFKGDNRIKNQGMFDEGLYE